MNQKQWTRVSRLFDRLVGLAEAERRRFLERLARKRPSLTRELSTLLEARGDATDFLEVPAYQLVDHDLEIEGWRDEEPEFEAGATLAGYRIVRRIGSGGMGLVYEAFSETTRDLVALKVMRSPPNRSERSQRRRARLFEREGKALARLDHAGIARILAAGESEDGRVYLAMELVHGEPLGTFVLHARPSLDARIALFLEICDAVHYAHSRGVVHRDLKPSNILVAPAPGPGDPPASLAVKVCDFGLARIRQEEIGHTSSFAETGSLMGTLAYMSPEQASGHSRAIGAASDQYSLGVILFQLLTDQHPLDLRDLSVPQAVRSICTEVPRDPIVLNPDLPVALKIIALKCLEKEARDRYQSVAHLGDDVRRWRDGQPITARAGGTATRVLKLLRRYRIALALSLGLFGLSSVAALSMAYLHHEAEAAEQRARMEAQAASETVKFLEDILTSVDPHHSLGRAITVREVLDQAVDRIDAADQLAPEVAAAVRATLGRAFMALGEYEPAKHHLDTSLALHRGEQVDDPLGLAQALQARGELALKQGQYRTAGRLLRECLELTSADRPRKEFSTNLVRSLLARSLRFDGRTEEAERLLREAIANESARPGADGLVVARIQNDLAGLLVSGGEFVESEALYRESLETQECLLASGHLAIAENQNNLASLLLRTNRPQEALPLFRAAHEVFRRVLEPGHPDLVTLTHNLGMAAKELGHLREAEAHLTQAVAARRKLFPEGHPHLASSLHNLGLVFLAQGNTERAHELVTESVAMSRSTGVLPVRLATRLATLAATNRTRQQYQDAIENCYEALEAFDTVPAVDHPYRQLVQSCLAQVLLETGAVEECADLVRELLHDTSTGPPKPLHGHRLELFLALAIAQLGQPDGANAEIERILAQVNEEFGPDSDAAVEFEHLVARYSHERPQGE